MSRAFETLSLRSGRLTVQLSKTLGRIIDKQNTLAYLTAWPNSLSVDTKRATFLRRGFLEGERISERYASQSGSDRMTIIEPNEILRPCR